jgi:NAD(P)H dehydrogenase (quinone)
MYAITGITGNVGSAMARALLAAGKSVRAVVRDAGKGRTWADEGCELALAKMQDAVALARAFSGAEGVFILPPPEFDPAPGFPEGRAIIAAVKNALEVSPPKKVVCLSTIGAQATQTNLLTLRTMLEQALRELPISITFLRPAWFMENFAWDLAPACERGVLSSFLQPLDKPVPVIATADVGRVAAELIQQEWQGVRVVELEAARRVTPLEIGATFARLLGRPVAVEAVPRETWDALFRSQGMKNPEPRIRMLDGFNEGWIEFERGPLASLKGIVTLDTVLEGLLAR